MWTIAHAAGVGPNDVIEEPEAKKLASFAEPLRQLDVLCARPEVTGGVIVGGVIGAGVSAHFLSKGRVEKRRLESGGLHAQLGLSPGGASLRLRF